MLDKQELKVGILFSLTGTTSITERGQYQACLLAIRHINENGGINGKLLIPIVEDAASDPDITYQKAEKLIVSDKVTAIIGCYTAACRKKVIPVLEKYNVLLFYPTINEGEEQHPNIFYSNSAPNQQLLDFIPWLIQNVGKTFYLLGSDYIYPREINKYVRHLVQMHGGTVFGEQYMTLGNQVFDRQINEIQQLKPDIVFSTLVGDSTISYYQQHERNGLPQVIASNVTAETEIKAITPKGTTEYYSCFAYFNSINNAQNNRFLAEFQRIYGTDIISSVMESSYNSIILLAEALRKSTKPTTDAIRQALSGLTIDAPQGKIMVDPLNQHVWLNSRIGKVNSSGQFTIIWESDHLIPPIPLFKDAFPVEVNTTSPVYKAELLELKSNRHQAFILELEKHLSELPYPSAYFDEEGVLIKTIKCGSSNAHPFMRVKSGEKVDQSSLAKSGIYAAYHKKNSPYEVTKEGEELTAGFPILDASGKLMAVLGVFLPRTSSQALLKSISSILQLCTRLAMKQEEQQIVNEALLGLTELQHEGLFIVKNGKIHFQNNRAQKIWEQKQSLVQSVIQELSFDTKSKERILRRDDQEEIFEIKAHYKNGMFFIQFKSLERQQHRFSISERENLTTNDLIGASEPFLKTIELARSAAKIQANTLLLGESGTGKELFARAIHNESNRKHKPFVAVNCGAISKDLINSELFGYVEGAFTGAKKGGSPGKFEIANGGTLFLDEIGEMPLELQTTLLRVLQEKEVVRVGGHKPIPLDVRIIAATNKDLFQEIAFNGSFRSDLYFRLNVFTIELIPLRQRHEDIAMFTNYYLEAFSLLSGQKKELSKSALAVMMKYNWPGNIRELSNIIERAFYLAGNTPLITQEHLPQSMVNQFQPYKRKELTPAEHPLHQIKSINEIKQKNYEQERQFYIQSLVTHKGNISKTAQHLGISRTTLYQKLKEYQIKTGKVKQ